jgi:hypothetical protein
LSRVRGHLFRGDELSKYRDWEFTVNTPHGAAIFRCRAKTEAAAIAARDRYLARVNGATAKTLHDRLSRRRLAG